MREVSEVGFLGLEQCNGSESLCDGHVGVMIFVAEGINDENIEILEEIEGLVRDDLDVRQVGE